MGDVMKKFYQTIRCGLVIPLALFIALCCCSSGKAHAEIDQMSVQQSMAGALDHACCHANKSSATKKCNCQNFLGSAESSNFQKPNGLPNTASSVNDLSGFAIVFIFSGRLSYDFSLTKSSQNNPPIYLRNRVFRL
ncbi:MAG: hypothetical protein NUV91_05750 [Candidatus Omnitrophica bacterium]|nr:hypothetical protein [Candidatus Omnitrophota bacterium]